MNSYYSICHSITVLPVALNVVQLRCDKVYHCLYCVLLPPDFCNSAQQHFPVGAVLGMPFAFLCTEWEMHVLRFLVEAEVA